MKIDFLTSKEVCDQYGISRHWLYKLTSQKRITHFKAGARLFFRREDIENFLTSFKVEAE